MKRESLIFCLGLFLFLGVLIPHLHSKQFQYTFTALHNEYKLINLNVRYKDGSEETANLIVTYYKMSRKLVYELTTESGQTGKVEAVAPDDPFLYDVMCTPNLLNSCQLFTEGPVFGQVCEPAFRRMFMDDEKRSALRQEYEALKAADLDRPPIILSPLNDSTHTTPSKVEIKLQLTRKPITPCRQWEFTVVFDRWDSSQGSNGKWVSGPHSYTRFQGYESANESSCFAEYNFKFEPGKYRVTARAKHKDGRQTPWSHHNEFSVKLNIPKRIVARQPGITITSPKSGQSFKVGDSIHVQWNSYGINQNVKIGLVKGGNIILFTPAGGTENDGNWRGTIPSNVPPDTYRLGVATEDNAIRDLVENIIIKN